VDDELARIRNKEIGFVFQTFNLLPRADALHNVELPLIYAGLGAKERKARAAQALRRVGLGTAWTTAPTSCRRPAPTRGDRPGAGEQPSILLADEPTGNLDSTTGLEIMGLFRELHDAARPW